MSRLGKLPIELPAGTQAKIEGDVLVVKGKKGELKQTLNQAVKVEVGEKEIILSIKNKTNIKEKSLWGLYWRLVKNMVQGVNDGFEKKLEIVGVGYRVNASGKNLNISVGYSHPVVFELPDGIAGQAEGNIITLSGIDKQLLGETAARIRKIRQPEPYKGKGIKYVDEVIRRKEGKAAVKGS